jgi:hypothetical protein
LDCKASRVLPEVLALKVPQDLLEPLVQPDFPVLLVHKEPWVPLVQQVNKALLVPLELKELPEPPVLKD